MFLKYIRLVLLACCFLLATNAGAQDKIYLDDGTVIEAKVKEISPRSIVYRRWDNQEGADYILTRREVNRIVYQNGTEERMINRSERPNPFRNAPSRDGHRSTGNRMREPVPGYGNNILAIAPLQMTNESVAGVGIHYEHILDKPGIFSLYLPVAFSFFDDNVSNYNLKATRVFAYLYPGVKIYPGGSSRRVSYSVGPSFGLGFGTKYKETRVLAPGGSVIIRYDEASVFKAGFIINNGINIQPTKRFYIGLELGVGIMYYNNEQTDYIVGDEGIIQFNFKMGYRF